MAIQKQAARSGWTPWTPFSKPSMDSSQPDMPEPNWPGTFQAKMCSSRQHAMIAPSNPQRSPPARCPA